MSSNSSKRFTFDPERDGTEMPTLTSLIYGKKEHGAPPPPPGGKKDNDDDAFSLDPTKALDRNELLRELGLPTPPASGSESGGIASALPPAPPPGGEGISLLDSTQSTAGIQSEVVLSHFMQERKEVPQAHVPDGRTSMGARRYLKSSWAAEYPDLIDFFEAAKISSYPAAFRPVLQFLYQQKKIMSALVMETTATSGSDLVAKHALFDKSKLGAWLGVRIHPQTFSDLWGRLQKFSYTEFSPVGLASQSNTIERKAFRAAFGVEKGEWLTLIHHPKISKTQLVAVISAQSISASLPAAFDQAKGKAAEPHLRVA